MEKQIVEVNIAGQTFRLKTESTVEHVLKVAEIVDKQIGEIMEGLKSGSLQNAAILAALNIAEENLLHREKFSKSLEKLEERSKKIMELVESDF